MLRILLITILVILAIRAIGRLLGGVLDGVVGPQRKGPKSGVEMVRDPVCGTFVLPGQALTLADGPRRIYFCSARCRDAYRAKSA